MSIKNPKLFFNLAKLKSIRLLTSFTKKFFALHRSSSWGPCRSKINDTFGGLTGRIGSLPSANSIVHKLINEERKKRGIPPVRWNQKLYYLAKQQANYCAEVGRLVHSDRFAFDGGENLCGGKGNITPRSIVNTWLKSKAGHREYLLSSRVKSAGVAISKSRHGTYCAWSFSDKSVGQAHHHRTGRKRVHPRRASLLGRVLLALRRFWGF